MTLINFSSGSVDFPAAVTTMWKLIGIIWLIGMYFRRPAIAKARQRLLSFIIQSAMAALAFVLLLTDWLRFGWLAWRFAPDSFSVQLAGFSLALIGCLVAICARVTLGGNWSARPSLQQNHCLVT